MSGRLGRLWAAWRRHRAVVVGYLDEIDRDTLDGLFVHGHLDGPYDRAPHLGHDYDGALSAAALALTDTGWDREIGQLRVALGYPCCDLHGRTCEPPGELCCPLCAEVDHPRHPTGVGCVAAGDVQELQPGDDDGDDATR